MLSSITMCFNSRYLSLLLILAPASAAVVSDVRFKLSAGDLSSAEALVEDYHRANGANSEYAAAVSWLARGALTLGQTETAARYLAETKTLVAALLKTKRVDDDSFLEAAVGASIEVEARIMAARGNRDKAVAFLESEVPHWKTWWIEARIHKNLDLLTLEGQPAPELDASYRGSPVLLFLWAHWCGDCKAEVAILANIQRTFAPRGLVLIGPTRLYGYVAGGEDSPPDKEKRYIEEVRRRYYAVLPDMPVPLSASNFIAYGASTTPTLVLIDRAGVVRYYHPGAAGEAELSARIRALR